MLRKALKPAFLLAIVYLFGATVYGQNSAQVMSDVYSLLKVLDASQAQGEFACDKEGGIVSMTPKQNPTYRRKLLTGKLLGLYDHSTGIAYSLLGVGDIKKFMTTDAVVQPYASYPFLLHSSTLGTDEYQSQRMSFGSLIDFIAQHPGLKVVPLPVCYRDLSDKEAAKVRAALFLPAAPLVGYGLEYLFSVREIEKVVASFVIGMSLSIVTPVLAFKMYRHLRYKVAPYSVPKVVFDIIRAVLANEPVLVEEPQRVKRLRRMAAVGIAVGLAGSLKCAYDLWFAYKKFSRENNGDSGSCKPGD
ncbi:MAG: hypothetical protein QG632_504 [Candidatus Dependentiae bacterium]|nr:hypothetical protein [Candidatus Dependentiae bacterium]